LEAVTVSDDEHHEEEGFRNEFENTDEEEDPLSDIALRRATVKSYLQIQDDLKAMGAKPFFLPPQPEFLLSVPESESPSGHPSAQAPLHFYKSELEHYIAQRKAGLAKKSLDWLDRAYTAFWQSTRGQISGESMTALRAFTLQKYKSIDSHRKILGFATSFLKHLSRTRGEPRYQSFDVYLELPKAVMARRAVTGRIVTREDIAAVFERITACAERGEISAPRARNYHAFALLAGYTGLRPSTIQRLTVAQVKAALSEQKPFLHVLAEQEKNRTEHYVPLHPSVVAAVREVLTHDFQENDDSKPFFMFNSFDNWLKRQKVPLPHVRDSNKAHLWLSDFRKFTQQYGDILGWDTTNQKYVLAHGMTGVDWAHYRNPLPEPVYDVYMQCWRDVKLG
jgi:integrase